MGDFDWAQNGRYIFFSSLYEQNKVLYRIGVQRLKNTKIAASLNNQQSSNFAEEQRFTAQIAAYLSMLQSMHQNLLNNEQFFLNQNIDILKKSKFFSNITSIIESMSDGKSITENEYRQIIAFFNVIQNHTDLDTLKSRVDQELNNIKLLNANFQKLSKEEQKDAKQSYIENPKAYNSQFGAQFYQTIVSEVEGKEITLRKTELDTEAYAKRINSILKNLSKKPEFRDLIIKIYNQHINETNFTVIHEGLKALILEQATLIIMNKSNSARQINDLTNELFITITEAIKNVDLTIPTELQRYNIFGGDVKDTTLEKYALTTDQNLVYLLELASNAQEILEKYQQLGTNKNLIQLWNELEQIAQEGQSGRSHHGSSRYGKKANELNKFLRQNIGQFFFGEKFSGDLRTYFKNQKKRLADLLKEKNASSTYIDNGILSILPEFADSCTLTVTKSDTAEIIALACAEKLPSIFEGKLPGKAINLKDDVQFIITPTKNIDELLKNFSNKVSKERITQIQETVRIFIKETIGSFLDKYHDAGKGSTNVNMAKNIYIDLLNELQKKLTSIYKDTNELEIAFNLLKNTMLGGVSVKEYGMYNNDLGYHGGSLGASGAPEGVLNNIETMYNSGGLKMIDKEKLLFAILNCAPSAIGSNLKENLENYLLGGAALIMFDEGFTAGANYVKEVQTELQNDMMVGPKNISLYFLNNAYVPASYILYNIYNSVYAFYNRLPHEVNQVKQRNRVVITNNASEALVQRLEGDSKNTKESKTFQGYQKSYKSNSNNLQERFKIIGQAAMDEITIQFLFMAGMLDILEDLQKTLTIKK